MTVYILLFRAKYVQIHGVEYHPGCVLRLEEMTIDGNQDFPLFGEVDQIIVWEDEKMFVVSVLEPVEFNSHYMGYEVKRVPEKIVKTYNELPWHGVLHKIIKNEKYFVVDKDTSSVEIL